MAEIVTMPKLGFDMAEGTLIRWVVLEGEPVAKGAILAEIETDKATVEVESTFEGIIARQLVREGDIVPVNTPIAVIGEPGEEIDTAALLGEAAVTAESQPVEPAPTVETTSQVPITIEGIPEAATFPSGVKSSPLARRIAAEHGIDLRSVTGSGPSGRVVKKDIEAYLAQEKTAFPPVMPAYEAPVTPTMELTPVGPPPPDRRIPLNRLRAAIGRRMVSAKQEVPHFYVTREFDMANLMALRQQVNQMLPEGEKTSVNDYLVKAVALALRQFPNLNASFSGTEILHHGQVNVGVAVAVEGGLLTVVCQNTDRKSVRQIASEVRTMVLRARAGKVRPDDIEGSTFSVSNLGMFDVDHFIAIINPPEAAILAVGAVAEVPVIKNGEIVPGVRMKATISVDHRVSDGAEAAQFLQALDVLLSEPLRLFI